MFYQEAFPNLCLFVCLFCLFCILILCLQSEKDSAKVLCERIPINGHGNCNSKNCGLGYPRTHTKTPIQYRVILHITGIQNHCCRNFNWIIMYDFCNSNKKSWARAWVLNLQTESWPLKSVTHALLLSHWQFEGGPWGALLPARLQNLCECHIYFDDSSLDNCLSVVMS